MKSSRLEVWLLTFLERSPATCRDLNPLSNDKISKYFFVYLGRCSMKITLNVNGKYRNNILSFKKRDKCVLRI